MLLESHKRYVSHRDEACITSMLTQYDPVSEEDFIVMLDICKCFRKPSADNLCEILSELAHQEVTQHPRHFANSFRQMFKAVTNHLFGPKDDLIEFYKKREPTNKKFIRAFKTSTTDTMNDENRNVISHLHRYIKSPKQVLASQSAITCSKLTIETLEQGVKYVQS